MLQRHSLNRKRVVLIYDLLLLCINGYHFHLIFHGLHKEFNLLPEENGIFLRSINSQLRSTSEHSKRRQQSHQPETMVAMHVTDKDGIQLREMNVRAAELHLSTFTTINHEALAPHLNELRGSVMFKSRQRTATPQNMYLKRFHLQNNSSYFFQNHQATISDA